MFNTFSIFQEAEKRLEESTVDILMSLKSKTAPRESDEQGKQWLPTCVWHAIKNPPEESEKVLSETNKPNIHI